MSLPAHEAAAAAALRRLTAAAAAAGLTPPLPSMAALMAALPGVQSAAAEQDLVAALSCGVESFGGAPQAAAVSDEVIQRVLGPLHATLASTLAALDGGPSGGGGGGGFGSGRPAPVPLPPALDALLERQLLRVRVMLDAASSAGEASGGDGGGGSPAAAVPAAAPAADGDARSSSSGAAAAAAAASSGPPHAAARRRHRSAALRAFVHELWPPLHAIVARGGCGRFLGAAAKACCAALAADAPAAAPVAPMMLEAAVCAFGAPGGAPFADVAAAAVEAFSAGHAPAVAAALRRIWAQPEVAALQAEGGGDASPEAAQHFLRLAAAFLRHGGQLVRGAGPAHARVQPPAGHAADAPPASPAALLEAAGRLVDGAVAAAAACCGSNHRRVCAAALSALGAALAATGDGDAYADAARRVLVGRGPALGAGLLRALLAPSPLPRVQRVGALLTELASLAAAAEAPPPPAASSSAMQTEGSDAGPGGALLACWLSGALAALPQGALAAGEGEALLADLLALLLGGSGGGRRSYLAARRLKKVLREFAERHASAVGGPFLEN